MPETRLAPPPAPPYSNDPQALQAWQNHLHRWLLDFYSKAGGASEPIPNRMDRAERNIRALLARPVSVEGVTVSGGGGGVASPSYFFARHEATTDDQADVGDDATPTYSDVEYNVGSDYDGTNIYTAPSDGLYQFAAAGRLGGGGGGEDTLRLKFVHPTYGEIWCIGRSADYNFQNAVGSIVVPLNAADIIYVKLEVTGGAPASMDITGASENWFMGALLQDL